MNFQQSNLMARLPKQFFASLVQKVNAKIVSGIDVINLGQGNPDQPTPAYIVRALQLAAAKPLNHRYAPFRGLHELKVAAAAFYKEKYRVTADPEKEIAILGGSKIGLVELPWALMNPNPDDLLLLPNPGYPDYLSGAALSKVHYETYPLLEENGFLPDLASIPEDQAQKAKFIYINYPNNPTGAVANRAFYEELISWAEKYEVGVVSDFAYGAIGFDGQPPLSFMSVAGAKEVGVEFYTFSKTFNMAGWRLAFAVGNAAIIEALNLIQDHLFVSVFSAVQEAGVVALTAPERDKEIAQIIAAYEKRRDAFVTAAHDIGWKAFVPRGTFYALIPVAKGYTSESFADLLLDKAGVAVAPANGFGSLGEGYVRIGLLVEPERLVEAVERIEKLRLF